MNDFGACPVWLDALSACPKGSYGEEVYHRIQKDAPRGYSFESLGYECDTPLYAFDELEDSEAIRLKQYRRDPHVIWRFRVPGQDGASITIRPVYRRVQEQERNDPEFGFLWDNHPGSHTFDGLHHILLKMDGQSISGNVDHRLHLITVHGTRTQAKVVRDFYYVFATDPRAILAMESERCCLCGKALTDGLSRSRGIGPECFRGWKRLQEGQV